MVPADLLFAFNSATLLPEANQYLAPIAARASAGSYSVSITGQASPDGGTASYNLRLSALRARAVQHRLITLGLAAHQIAQVKGIGTAGQSCVANGMLGTKCAQLRRVVITLSPPPLPRNPRRMEHSDGNTFPCRTTTSPRWPV